MGIFLRQSTQVLARFGPFLDKTDGVTEKILLAGNSTEISKNHAAFGAGPVLGVHDSDGWYPITLTTTHTETVGPLLVKSNDSAVHLPVWREFYVLEEAVFDALFAASSSALAPAAVANLEDMLDGTGGVTLSLGRLVVSTTNAGGAVSITNTAGYGMTIQGPTGLSITGTSTYGLYVIGNTVGTYFSGSTYGFQIVGTIDGKFTPIDVDGITFASAMEAVLAVLTGVAAPSGSDVVFKKRNGTTTKVTITYGTTDGERTVSTFA